MRDILQNTGTFSPDQIAEMKKYSASEQFITEEAYRGGVSELATTTTKVDKGAEELPCYVTTCRGFIRLRIMESSIVQGTSSIAHW